MARIVILIVLLAAALPTWAQFPGIDTAAQRAAMKPLEIMHGQWLGQGERYRPDGERYYFTQTLEIRPEAEGLMTTIAGQSLRHLKELEDRHELRPGTGSFAVVMHDEAAGDYLFRSFGFGTLVEARAGFVRDRVFRWVVDGPVMLRFTIDLTEDGVWEELGERSVDGGETWVQTNRLTAYRVEAR